MIRTARRAALRIFSGRKLYNFGLPERLRTLRQSIFTGGVVKVNGICSACFLRKRRRCGEQPPSVACGDSSLKGTPFGNVGKLAATTKAVPLGKVAANAVSRRKGYSRGKWLYT